MREWRVSLLYSSVGLIYFFAFCSLYSQFPGLLGHNGVLPADLYVSRVLEQIGAGRVFWEVLLEFPSVLILAEIWGVPVDCMSEFVMLCGILSSVFIIVGFATPVMFVLSWGCYLSMYLVGQTFLSFQWDILLLEVGFLCIVTSSLQWLTGSSYNKLGSLAWAYRFLLFKLMLMAGATKLQAGCPSWDKLTALEYHFATQPLPSMLAWYSHQLHPLLLRVGVAATLLIELPATLLVLYPQRIVRLWGALLQVLLQLLIIATGNYNFFNLLTLVLVIPVCERDCHSGETSTRNKKRNSLPGAWAQTIFVYAFLAYSCWVMFEAQYISVNDSTDLHPLDRVLIQVHSEFHLDRYMTPFGIAGFALTIIGFVFSTLNNKASPVSQSLYIVVIILYVQYSFMSFSSIGVNVKNAYNYPPGKYSILFTPEQYERMQSFSSKRSVQVLHLSSSYGLFRRMTGMGQVTPGGDQKGVGGMPPSVVARPEILLEGLSGEDSTWYPIHFRYKPGNVTEMPSFVIPHQPRLDWQMWFAALGGYSNNPWLVHFIYKLLAGHCPEVIQLINAEHFRKVFRSSGQPASIRASIVDFDFTRWNSSWARGLYPHFISQSTSGSSPSPFVSNSDLPTMSSTIDNTSWWFVKPETQKAYLPLAIDKHNPSVQQFLQAYGLPSNPDGKANYQSANSLKDQCHSAQNIFVANIEECLSSWMVPSPLQKMITAILNPFRGCICSAISARRDMLDISPSEDSSVGTLQAIAVVIIIIVPVVFSSL